MVQSLERRFTQMGTPSQATLDRIALLLELGAVVQAPLPQGGQMVDALGYVPAVALLLIEKGASVSQQGLLSIHAATKQNGLLSLQASTQEHGLRWCKDEFTHIANQQRLMQLATRQPKLDWYAEVGPSVDDPVCVLDMEAHAPGLNEVLEAAQAKQGLHVGRDIQDRATRLNAIRCLYHPTSPNIWMGSHDRVKLLDQLMKDDITVHDKLEWGNEADDYYGSMFINFLGSSEELCRAVLHKGAPVGIKEITIFMDSLEYLPTRDMVAGLLPDLLDRMEQWKDEIHPAYNLSMLDLLLQIAPQEFAAWQADRIETTTRPALRNPSSLRL